MTAPAWISGRHSQAITQRPQLGALTGPWGCHLLSPPGPPVNLLPFLLVSARFRPGFRILQGFHLGFPGFLWGFPFFFLLLIPAASWVTRDSIGFPVN